MNYPGPLRILTAGEDLSQRVHQRRAPVPWSRMDDQAGGLLDHRQPRVGVDEARLPCHSGPARRPPVPTWPKEMSTSPTAPSVNVHDDAGAPTSVTTTMRNQLIQIHLRQLTGLPNQLWFARRPCF